MIKFIDAPVGQLRLDTAAVAHLVIIGKMCGVAENPLDDEFILFDKVFDPAFLRPSETPEPGQVRGIYDYAKVRQIMAECCQGHYVDLDLQIDLMVKGFEGAAPLFN